MKKMLIVSLLLAISSLGAKSVKVKIAELRTALAEHAKSEVESWTILKELDKRMSKLEQQAAYNLYQDDNPDQNNN